MGVFPGVLEGGNPLPPPLEGFFDSLVGCARNDMKLDLTKVPKSCVHLATLAERWGIGDDFDREQAVAKASKDDLRELVNAIQALPDETLFDWLAGPESYSQKPTKEYVAFTCLIMAYDSARVKLERYKDTEHTN